MVHRFSTQPPEQHTITRHRKDFGLNAVEDLEVREEVASVLCNSLPSIFNLLGSVKTFEPDATGETIRQAIMAILEVKSVGPRKKTGQCYASAANIFLKFCEDNKMCCNLSGSNKYGKPTSLQK